MVRMEGSQEGVSAVWEEGGRLIPQVVRPTAITCSFFLSCALSPSLPLLLTGNWALEELSVEGGLAGDLGLVMKVSHVIVV